MHLLLVTDVAGEQQHQQQHINGSCLKKQFKFLVQSNYCFGFLFLLADAFLHVTHTRTQVSVPVLLKRFWGRGDSEMCVFGCIYLLPA